MSHEQRLNNLGIPTNLPEHEERLRVEAKLRDVEAELARAEARYGRGEKADRQRLAAGAADKPKPGRKRTRGG